MLLLFLCTAALGGCGSDETEERKITGHKEYVLTVASEKRLGMAPSGGSLLTQVYAVRKESSAQWESLASCRWSLASRRGSTRWSMKKNEWFSASGSS